MSDRLPANDAPSRRDRRASLLDLVPDQAHETPPLDDIVIPDLPLDIVEQEAAGIGGRLRALVAALRQKAEFRHMTTRDPEATPQLDARILELLSVYRAQQARRQGVDVAAESGDRRSLAKFLRSRLSALRHKTGDDAADDQDTPFIADPATMDGIIDETDETAPISKGQDDMHLYQIHSATGAASSAPEQPAQGHRSDQPVAAHRQAPQPYAPHPHMMQAYAPMAYVPHPYAAAQQPAPYWQPHQPQGWAAPQNAPVVYYVPQPAAFQNNTPQPNHAPQPWWPAPQAAAQPEFAQHEARDMIDTRTEAAIEEIRASLREFREALRDFAAEREQGRRYGT